MKKAQVISTVIAILCLTVMASVACTGSDNGSQDTGLQIIDHLGRTVTLQEVPQRIISISPANTEILFALGLEERIVGVTNYCNYPVEALEKEKVGGFSTPDIEKIIALEPDIVLAASIHEDTIIPQLEGLGVTVVALIPQTVDEVMVTIELVGSFTGTEDAAASLTADMQARIDAVSDLVATLSTEDIPDVFYVVWHDPPRSAGGNTLQSQVIELAGGRNIFADISDYSQVGDELISFRNPDIIVVGTGMGSGANAPLEWAQSDEPSLLVTKAHQTGRIFSIETDLVGRFGPRIVEGLEEMLRLLHPELADQLP